MTTTRKIATFALALLLSAVAWTCAEGQEERGLQVNPALEAEWFQTWEDTHDEAVWCGYGMIWEEGTLVISNHERPEVREKGATWMTHEPCPPVNENARLVAEIHTHPSLTQLKERVPTPRWLKIKAWRQRHYGTTEYECELSQTDRQSFREAQYREVRPFVSIVICDSDTYAYRAADNIYGGEPTIVVRENTDG